ncbi:MAG: hypothetical protein K1X74_09030 [Pirellulales bacterium]|nr:hypothetical protein [Pirellulales bacterium]
MSLGTAVLALVLDCYGSGGARAQVPGLPPTTWERSAYRVQLVVLIDPTVGISSDGASALTTRIVERVAALVGARWELQLGVCPPLLRAALGPQLAEVAYEALPPELRAGDKVVFLQIAQHQGTPVVSVREFDVRTQTWSPPPVAQPVEAAQLVDRAVVAVIAAVRTVARVDDAEIKSANLTLMGCELLARDPSMLAVPPGTVLQSFVRFNDRNGQARRIMPIEWTYLTVAEASERTLRCDVYSGVRGALTVKTRGRVEKLAIVVPPPVGGTRLRLVARDQRADPLAGYEVYAHAPGERETTLLGRTDGDGSIWVEAAESPLRVLLVKSGGEFMARLPIVPGKEPLLQALVPDDRERLRAEGVIIGLQEGLVDLVAQRAVLVIRIQSMLDAGNVEAATKLLESLRKLRNQQEQYSLFLRQQRQAIVSRDPAIQRKIELLFADTEKLMTNYFDPRPLDEIESSVLRARSVAPANSEAAQAAATAPAGS